ncbi:ChbG/HpnK family deacetylase [Patescibacteria group bacterium]|nr:ChbG/HpnK family deacetylase [Patescibacteria group bacterium]
MKKLIIVAHDYGLCGSVNQGIEYVLEHKNNIISDVSLLVNAPGSNAAVEYIKKNNISACLNLNLTTFMPISKNTASLVDDKGYFKKVDISTWDFSAIDSFKDKEVENEINAQYRWFVEKVGRKPSAILSRKNETGDPKILLPMVELAQKEKLPVRAPVWGWKENYGAQSFVEQSGVKLTNHVFIGLKDWKGRFGYDPVRDLASLIKDINKKEGISELLFFAGFVDKELFSLSTINWQRGQFVQLIAKGNLTKEIKSNFQLISYSDL